MTSTRWRGVSESVASLALKSFRAFDLGIVLPRHTRYLGLPQKCTKTSREPSTCHPKKKTPGSRDWGSQRKCTQREGENHRPLSCARWAMATFCILGYISHFRERSCVVPALWCRYEGPFLRLSPQASCQQSQQSWNVCVCMPTRPTCILSPSVRK